MATPTKISESALRGMVEKYVREALENETLSWPSQYWTEDDVDEYRAMSREDQQSVDRDQLKFDSNGGIKTSETEPVEINQEELESAFVEAKVRQTLNILRENISKMAATKRPSAMSRLI